MCGIAGVAGDLNRDRVRAAVEAMIGALAHRGPDDEGSWISDGFGFGMRRLSIIDLAGGHQPMWDSRTGLGLVYNGEVYNYQRIRADLQRDGAVFQTSSDTEVVLHSLARHGVNSVHDWNGMFAVAAWNPSTKKLLLIRDRLGVKPLYYFWDGATLTFASEIKALLASGLVARTLNRQAMWDYLTYRYVPEPETMWSNIWKLPPGHFLEWSPASAPKVTNYWKTDVLSPNEPVDIEQKTKEFADLFLDSVEHRLLASDVPVGVMLSGGLDSSAIAAAAVELGHKNFHTFSVGFAEGGEFSELEYARRVARHLGLQNHEVIVDQREFLDLLPAAVRAADEPLADLTIVPLLAILRLARQHVKVALSGEGADEVLAGYKLHSLNRRFEAIRQIQRLPSSLIASISIALKQVSRKSGDTLAKIASIPLSDWNVTLRNYMTWYWEEDEKASLGWNFRGRDSARLLETMYAAAHSSEPLDQLLAVMQKSWLVEDLLMKADKMSMATSLELRVPFLDYRLVEWANRQPVAVKIGTVNGRNVTKRVLRRFASGRLPEEIIARPKKGFPVPVSEWLRNEPFRTWAVHHITGKHAKLKDIFATATLNRQLEQAAAGNGKAADRVWALLVLETWMKEYRVDLATEPVGLLTAGTLA